MDNLVQATVELKQTAENFAKAADALIESNNRKRKEPVASTVFSVCAFVLAIAAFGTVRADQPAAKEFRVNTTKTVGEIRADVVKLSGFMKDVFDATTAYNNDRKRRQKQ